MNKHIGYKESNVGHKTKTIEIYNVDTIWCNCDAITHRPGGCVVSWLARAESFNRNPRILFDPHQKSFSPSSQLLIHFYHGWQLHCLSPSPCVGSPSIGKKWLTSTPMSLLIFDWKGRNVWAPVSVPAMHLAKAMTTCLLPHILELEKKVTWRVTWLWASVTSLLVWHFGADLPQCPEGDS